ncbi:MAG: 3-phosphoglycerate dehydrogenase family protein [Phycisphaerae bacterium]
MKVLICDSFEEIGLRGLRDAGCDVTCDPALQGDALRDAVASVRPAILIARSTRITAEMIEAADTLGLIIRAGAGYNTIDVATASARGVAVANCPGKNAVAVAELTFALILSLDRRVAECVGDLAQGRWKKKEYAKARGLKGRTLGVVGTGGIGREVIRRAAAFEMPVVAWSRSLTDARAAELNVTRCERPADVAERCDILTIHVAAAPETRNLINAEVLARLKPGSYVINTSRAEVVDHDALAKAVEAKQLRVGLDVFPDEPSTGIAEFNPPILQAGGIVYGTHHIGASTAQAQQAIAREVVRMAAVYAETGAVPNCVNFESMSKTQCQMVVRHYDKVGVLASVLDAISRADISVEEMTNTIYRGRRAAVAVLRLDKQPASEVVKSIAGMKDKVIHVEVQPGLPPR